MKLIDAAIATGLSKVVAGNRIKRISDEDKELLSELCKNTLPAEFVAKFNEAVAKADRKARGKNKGLAIKTLVGLLMPLLMLASGQAQLVQVQEAVSTTSQHNVTTVVTKIGAKEISAIPAATEPTVQSIATSKVVSLLELSGYGPASVEFEHADGSDASDSFSKSGDLWTVKDPGKYRVIAIAVNRDTLAIKKQKQWVEVNDPKPASKVADGLRVLIVYETEHSTREKYVQDIIASPVIRNYVIRKSDGKENNFRYYDQHTQFTSCNGPWCKLMARPRESLPWVIIQNDEHMHEGPLPSDVAGFLELLKTYGG